MPKSIEGVFRNGKIELLEPAPQAEDSRVVVTFLPSRSPVDLVERGIALAAAADLRARLGAIAEDWNRPIWTCTMRCNRGDVVVVTFLRILVCALQIGSLRY
jgi:hypothetical protein